MTARVKLPTMFHVRVLVSPAVTLVGSAVKVRSGATGSPGSPGSPASVTVTVSVSDFVASVRLVAVMVVVPTATPVTRAARSPVRWTEAMLGSLELQVTSRDAFPVAFTVAVTSVELPTSTEMEVGSMSTEETLPTPGPAGSPQAARKISPATRDAEAQKRFPRGVPFLVDVRFMHNSNRKSFATMRSPLAGYEQF